MRTVSVPNKAKTTNKTLLVAYNVLEMPFSKNEKVAVHVQALRAVISANLPFQAFEDIEMLKLCSMLHRGSPAILPSQEVLAGSLLNQVSEVVDSNLLKILQSRTWALVCFILLTNLIFPDLQCQRMDPHPKMLHMHVQT